MSRKGMMVPTTILLSLMRIYAMSVWQIQVQFCICLAGISLLARSAMIFSRKKVKLVNVQSVEGVLINRSLL